MANQGQKMDKYGDRQRNQEKKNRQKNNNNNNTTIGLIQKRMDFFSLLLWEISGLVGNTSLM